MPAPTALMPVVDSVTIECAVDRLAIGVVVGRRCSMGRAPAELASAIDAAVAEASAHQNAPVIGQVRDMLRHGKYKPTGRGKPASEYLLRAAVENRFPSINNLVDINNLVSLRSLLPISLVDLVRAGRDHFVVRYGRPSESYVFNSAGQKIDVEDLVVVARVPDDEPCANPVKDSMMTKLDDGSTDVMAVLYAPAQRTVDLARATEMFEEALDAWGGAQTTSRTTFSCQAQKAL
jgi:DNA/RNA-binding domain of Phe-tRNA-synthetase-like protein